MSSGISLPLTSSNLALVESCHGNAAVVAYVAEQAAAHSHVHLFAQPLSKNLVSLRTSRRTATAGGSHKQSRLGSPPLDISKHTALLNSAHPCEIKDACPSTPIKGDGLERARREFSDTSKSSHSLSLHQLINVASRLHYLTQVSKSGEHAAGRKPTLLECRRRFRKSFREET